MNLLKNVRNFVDPHKWSVFDEKTLNEMGSTNI